MKKYTDMTAEEITTIIDRGGNDLDKLNQQVRNYLDTLELSDYSKAVIDATEIRCMAECFGGIYSATDVDKYIVENYPEN